MTKNSSIIIQRSRRAPSLPAAERRDCAGFTLVDLLATVVVIGLLVAVALPAVSRADDYGNRASCWSNLRRLGMAVRMYAADNRDYLPFPNWANRYKGWLYTPQQSRPPFATTNAYTGGLLFPYTRDPGIYQCPADIESKYFRLRDNQLSSYVMNGAACGFAETPLRTFKMTEVWSAQAYLMWHPDENAGSRPAGPFVFNDASSYPLAGSEGLGTLHSVQGGEVVTVSGEVRFVTSPAFLREQESPALSLVWWNPGATDGR